MSETAFASAAKDREQTILPGGERLEAIIAAAAPFTDRVDGDFFEPRADGDAGVRDAVRRWIAEAAADPATARRVVARRAETDRELGAGLRSVRLRDPRRLPDWAHALAEFLAAQPATAAGDDASDRAGGIFESFRRAGVALLDWKDGTLEGVALSDEARDDVVRALGVRAWYACAPAIQFELRLHERPADEPAAAVLDVSLEGWLARFEALPGLAYVVGLTCRQWRDSVGEIFSRLRADLPLLRRTLWDGADPGAVVSFGGDAGDRHADGRAVALLGFATGRGVVYKPKDLGHTLAFMQVVDFLNRRGLPLALQTRTILRRGEYGWEERAVPAPCADESGFARFYRRLGMLARLVQLLEGRDLWADNLLAVGEHPVLTDLECLLYPRVTPPPTIGGARRDLLEVFEETVVRTGIVVQPWVPRPSIPIRDLGCLSHAGDPIEDAPLLPLPPYRPWCGDEVADPWCYGDEVVAGYRDMQAALLANRDELRAPGGPLALFERAQVRYIWRHTWDCQNILRASTSPRALVNGVEREIVLARVLRDAYGMLNGHPERIDLSEIAEAELDAFRRMDVPLFLSRTTSRSPFTTEGQEIRDHFQGTAWERLQARLEELPAFPLDEQVAVVAACIEGARNGAALTAPGAVKSAAARSPLAAAEEIADTLLAARVTAGAGSGWLGLSWYPVPDLYQVEVAGGDLLTGTGGIAVFLAELAVRTGNPRHWSAAYEVLDDLVEFVGGSSRFMSELRLAGGAPVPGGFAGPGAGIYAIARAAKLLGDATLLDTARALAAPAAAAALSGRACADVPFGSAGLLLDLLRLRADRGRDDELDAFVRELAAQAVGALADPAARFAPYAPTSRLAEFVPLGRDSIALAVARALIEAPELVDDADSVRSALASYRFDLGRRSGRLAALGAGREVTAAIPDTLGCRELVATAGEALVAGDGATAERLFRALAGRRDRTGGWFSDRWVDDRLNLSAVDGLVAVGLLALGVLDPELPPLTLLA